MHSINFTEHNEKIWLSLHYNGGNSYLFVNGKEFRKFKEKDSKIGATLFFVLGLVPVLKQRFNKLINGRSQTNKDQKSNGLFLQQYD